MQRSRVDMMSFILTAIQVLAKSFGQESGTLPLRKNAKIKLSCLEKKNTPWPTVLEWPPSAVDAGLHQMRELRDGQLIGLELGQGWSKCRKRETEIGKDEKIISLIA